MTIKLPKKTIADKFLKLLGKKRGVILPAGKPLSASQSFYMNARWENVWVALFRSKAKPLPPGRFDPDDIIKE